MTKISSWIVRTALVACAGAASAGCGLRATPPDAAPVLHLADVAPVRVKSAPSAASDGARRGRLDVSLDAASWSIAPPGEIADGGAARAAGALVARASGGDIVLLGPEMSVRAEEWEEIDVTFRIVGAPGAEIFWRGADEPQINPKTRIVLGSRDAAGGDTAGGGAAAPDDEVAPGTPPALGAAPTPASDAWQTLRIPKSRMKRWRGTIAQFALHAPAAPGGVEARLEIRELALRDRAALFADSATGVARYEMDSLSRPVVYAHAPAALEYDVAFPARAAFACGAGVLPGRGGARLRATLADARGRTIASREADAADDGRWAEIALDVPEGLARGRIRLEAEPAAGAAPGVVAFWANPVVYAREGRGAGDSSGAGRAGDASDPGANTARRPDLIVYLIDCLRSDRIGIDGHARGLTPEIDRFARGAVTFADAYSNATWTRPSLATIMTSIYPSGHGVKKIGDRLPDSFTTLAERLAAAGYETVAFTSNPNSGPPASLEQGFERMYLHGMSRDGDKYGTDLARLREWLATGRDAARPAFVFIHTIECHGPYLPPEPHASLFAPPGKPALEPEVLFDPTRPKSGVTARDLAFLSARWDATVHLADRNFGAAIDAMGERADDAYVFLLADHGESLGEHGVFGHDGPPFEEQIRVPYIVRPPRGAGAPPSPFARGNVQLVDLAPTALDLLGLASGGGSGASLRAALAGSADARGVPTAPARPVFAEQTSRPAIAVIDGAKKLVVRPDGAPDAPLLTDLASDPTESASRVADDPDLARLIAAWSSAQRAILDSAGAGAGGAGGAADSALAAGRDALDAESEERLRALGYIK